MTEPETCCFFRRVKNSHAREELPFLSLSLKCKTKNALLNEKVERFPAQTKNDSLLFSYIFFLFIFQNPILVLFFFKLETQTLSFSFAKQTTTPACALHKVAHSGMSLAWPQKKRGEIAVCSIHAKATKISWNLCLFCKLSPVTNRVTILTVFVTKFH